MCNYIYFNKHEVPTVDAIPTHDDFYSTLCADCNVVLGEHLSKDEAEEQRLKHLEFHLWFSELEPISEFHPRCKCYSDFFYGLTPKQMDAEFERVEKFEAKLDSLWSSGDPAMEEEAEKLYESALNNPVPKRRGLTWL